MRNVDIIDNARNINRSVVKGFYEDKITKGLLKKFTVKHGDKSYRFYTKEDALCFRKKIDLENNFIIRGSYD